jgi:hypothetical protein
VKKEILHLCSSSIHPFVGICSGIGYPTIKINKKVQVCGTHRTCMYNIAYSNDKKKRTKKETKFFDSDVDCNNYVDIQII